jgi:hypothetical protein
MPAHRKKKGRLIIRLRETSSAQTAEAADDEGRPTQTADNFANQPVQKAPEDAVLATEVASVQRQEDLVPGTEEVRSTDGREGVPAPVDTPAGSQVQAAQETCNPAETERNTALLSSQSSTASTAARRLAATRPVCGQREEILAILGTAMDRVRSWNGSVDAQLLAAAEAEIAALKRRLANCEEALKLKVVSLTEAEKGQVELRKALAEKEAELVAAHKEVAEERRRGASANHLRGKLRTAEEDIRSLQCGNGILRSDLMEARSKEKQRETAFAGTKTDMEQLRKRWEQVQSRLVAEVERTNAENTRLNQAMSDQQAELDKARKERDAAESRHRQRQAELGLVQLELQVAKEDVWTARASRADIMKDNDRLRKELEKKAFSAQANLKRIIERFREQTRVAIEMATATTLQSWAEQAAEL